MIAIREGQKERVKRPQNVIRSVLKRIKMKYCTLCLYKFCIDDLSALTKMLWLNYFFTYFISINLIVFAILQYIFNDTNCAREKAKELNPIVAFLHHFSWGVKGICVWYETYIFHLDKSIDAIFILVQSLLRIVEQLLKL